LGLWDRGNAVLNLGTTLEKKTIGDQTEATVAESAYEVDMTSDVQEGRGDEPQW